MKCENQMELTFPSQSRNEGFARAAVAAFAAQLDPNLDELGDIKTAVSEAVTNCIVHAYPDAIGPVTLSIAGKHPRYHRQGPGLRHCRRGAGKNADVLHRRRRSKRHGLYDHGELHDRASRHLDARKGHDGTYEA